jgi:hypothetical protein
VLLELGAFPEDLLGKAMSDFERALMNSIKANIPWAEVSLVSYSFLLCSSFWHIVITFLFIFGNEASKVLGIYNTWYMMHDVWFL